MKKGFTLTELLVVVLIIGVLSAIALPQYTKAVDKSRFSTLMPVANHVRDAQEAFYMASLEYTPDLQSAGVNIGTVTGNKAVIDDVSAEVTADGTDGYVTVSKEGLDNRYVLYFNKSTNYPQEIHCEALTSSDRAKSLCVTMGGEEIGANGSYTKYVLSGTGNGTTNSGGNTEPSTPEVTPTPDPDPEPEPDTPGFDYPGANLTPGEASDMTKYVTEQMIDTAREKLGLTAQGELIYTGENTATILYSDGTYATMEWSLNPIPEDEYSFWKGASYDLSGGAQIMHYDANGNPIEFVIRPLYGNKEEATGKLSEYYTGTVGSVQENGKWSLPPLFEVS